MNEHVHRYYRKFADEQAPIRLYHEVISLPEDYLAFLTIHDGFSKHTDTGIIKTKHLPEVHDQLIQEFDQSLSEFSAHEQIVVLADLLPFYESFGQSSYQCFFSRWRPHGQACNVYYSMSEKSISDLSHRVRWQENLAFPIFLDWLIFYLENIE